MWWPLFDCLTCSNKQYCYHYFFWYFFSISLFFSIFSAQNPFYKVWNRLVAKKNWEKKFYDKETILKHRGGSSRFGQRPYFYIFFGPFPYVNFRSTILLFQRIDIVFCWIFTPPQIMLSFRDNGYLLGDPPSPMLS